MPRNSISMKSAAGPFGEMSMGGLVTIMKVRDRLANYDEDPGWYKHPAGTVALKATSEELQRDGIDAKPPADRGSQRIRSNKDNGHEGH